MAGRKHHHVPQFLQRGFAVPSSKASQILVFRKDGSIFQTSTSNFGAERDFYASGEDFSVDDLITEFEPEIVKLFADLATNGPDALGDVDRIVTVLCHFEMRSNFLRSEMTFLAQEFGAFFDQLVSSEEGVEKLLQASSGRAKAEVITELEQRGIRGRDLEVLSGYIDSKFPDFIKDSVSDVSEVLSNVGPMKQLFASFVRGAHLKALQSKPSELARRRLYDGLRFDTILYDQGGVILPDSMVAVLSEDNIRPIGEAGRRIDEVILPLSSNRILIGYRRSKRSIEGRTINRMLASVSYESFISDRNTEENRRNISRIGRNAHLIPRAELGRMFRDFKFDG